MRCQVIASKSEPDGQGNPNVEADKQKDNEMPCNQTAAILRESSLCDEVKVKRAESWTHGKDVQDCNHVTNIELNCTNDNMSEYKQFKVEIEQREPLHTEINENNDCSFFFSFLFSKRYSRIELISASLFVSHRSADRPGHTKPCWETKSAY